MSGEYSSPTSLSYYSYLFGELSGVLEYPASYIASNAFAEVEDLVRDSISQGGDITMSRERLARLCYSLSNLLDTTDALEVVAEETGRDIPELLMALDEADAIREGHYQGQQDELMTLAAVVQNLLKHPFSLRSRHQAQTIVDTFLESYGPPSPLDKQEVGRKTVEFLASLSGLLPEDYPQPVDEPQAGQTKQVPARWV